MANLNEKNARLASKRRQAARRKGIIAVLGCIVVVATAFALMVPAISMTKGELTCGIEEHSHGDACYTQVLSCGQEEVEGHAHSDACYEDVLACGQEESDEHAHSDACYEKQLVCGQEETEGHTHSDACYESQLTCDKPEHAHTDACYTHEQAGGGNTVSNGPSSEAANSSSSSAVASASSGAASASSAAASASSSAAASASSSAAASASSSAASASSDSAKMPAAEFEKKLKRTDEPDVKVTVKAPEGALPEGATMEAKLIPADDVKAKVEEAIERESGEEAKIKSITAVDIVFKDKDGKEIEPAKAVQVKITSDDVREFEDPVLVHVLDKSKDSSKGNPHDAEVVEKVKIVNEDDNDKTVGTEDTMRFEAKAFSPYVIVELETITVPFTASDGSTYEVTVTYGPEAGIPNNAELVVSEVSEANVRYDEYVEQTAEAIGVDSDALTYVKLLDISIMVGDEIIQPKEPVDVQIRLMDKEESEDTTKVVHFGEEATEVVEADVSDEKVKFEAAGFSVYAVASYPAITSDLDGKTLVIVHENNQPYGYEQFSTYYGRALRAEAYSASALKGEVVRVEQHTSGYNIETDRARTEAGGVTHITGESIRWTFYLVDGTTDQYYIQDADSGKYLHMSDAFAMELSDDPQPMKVTPVSGLNKVQISCSIGTTTKFVRGNVNATTATEAGTGNKTFTFGNSAAGFTYLSLYEADQLNLAALDQQRPKYSGTKIASTELQDGDKVLIYRNEYSSIIDGYGDYILDGYGNPVLGVDNGDSIALRSAVNPVWTFRVVNDTSGNPSTYYIFENEQTHTVLIPNKNAGTLVVDAPWQPTQYTNNMTLPGKESGSYTSNFAYWDGSGSYVGYQIVENDDHTAMVTKPGSNSSTASANQSQQFSFAKVVDDSGTGLHPVDTVDTNAMHINLNLFDYPSWAAIDAAEGTTVYDNGNATLGRASATVGADGFPTFTATGTSASTLFGPGSTYRKGSANHLFLEDVYQSTGYLEYVCFNNFAEYKNGEFTVYAERGTPQVDGSSLKFSWQRGNFFPFNTLDPNKHGLNLFDDSGQLLDFDNPNYAEGLYGFKQATNYQFGMTMDFAFLMPEGGYINGEPMIYEFNGDDDLWIYVDGVLLLDIGGVHSAIPGTINFATGEIWNGATNGYITTIKQCFEDAGVFPDGTPWDENRVGEYFVGDTFADLGTHDFLMLYMEHGAGASNLKMRFNMPPVERGQFTVEKELKGDVQSQFANMQFAYQAFMQHTEQGHCELITSNADVIYLNKVNESTGAVEDVESQNIPVPFYNGVVIDGQTFDGVFYLKPGEKVGFKNRVEELDYYVQEIGIEEGGLITRVDIQGEQATGTPISPGSNYYNYACDEAKVRNRGAVRFSNYTVGERLLITKQLEEESVDIGDTFEVRVLLENEVGNLYQYAYGHYAVVDEDGVYYAYAGGRYEPVGTEPYFENQAGQYGTIEGLEAGMTVVIEGLVPGTDFFVDEIRVAPYGNPDPDVKTLLVNSGWIASYDVENEGDAQIHDTTYYDYQTGQMQPLASSMGSIKREEDKDAHITVTNEAKNRFEVHKVWGSDDPDDPTNNFVTQHGNVQIALFKVVGEGDEQTLEYIEGSLRTIVPGQSSHSYDANIKANVMSDDVVVREVKVTGEGATQVITPIDVNGSIAVSGEKTIRTTGDQTAIDTYVVTYDQGTPEPGTTGQIREDTVINTLPQVTVIKTDELGNNLQGAKFDLTDENGNVIAGFGGIVTGTDGLIISEEYMSNGTYYLVETDVPSGGYNKLPYKIQLDVAEEEAIFAAQTTESTPTPLADQTSDNPLLYTFKVVNSKGTELPMTGGPGTTIYVLGGLALIVAAVCIYGFGSRRGRERRSRG